MPPLGITEVIFTIAGFIAYAIPIAVAVWIIIILNRIHSGQKAIQNRLEGIEHALRQIRNSNEPEE